MTFSGSLERSVGKVLEGHRTCDIMEEGKARVGTREMGELIAAGLPA
ncbi:MAG: hypothetical protein HYX92_07580 [Chloroflexi bacterium]|nr:hypothetical protein [Chloroflexota bacterium]